MNKVLLLFAASAAIVFGACSGCKKSDRADRNAEVAASSTEALVETESGTVAGYIKDGTIVFKGIPYAKAERFMPPQPADRWEGVRSSRHYGPTAPQGKRAGWGSDETAFAFDWDDGYPGEDCQRVNIWTPGINDGKRRPVMVWLHGGGYSAGSGQELPSYEGTNLSKKGDVVVVTLNHRLNVLGFLDLSAYGDKYARSGNVGMLDIVAALEWVKNNIANFGGDPDNVTIFGQSGGGGKVSVLTAMPDAHGLFHKAIVQSGSTLEVMESQHSRRIGAAILEELGITPADIDRLSEVPYEELLGAGTRAIARAKERYTEETGQTAGLLFGWSPNVDSVVIPSQPYINGAPAISADVPMIIGSTLNEFAPSVYVPSLRNLERSRVEEMLAMTYGDSINEYIAAFEEAYPEHSDMDLLNTDFVFRPGVVKQADIKAQQGGAPVYVYLFAWQSPVLDGNLLSTHCMEIPFVFNNADVHASMTGGTPEALELADRMSQAWINFARTGNPGEDWPEYTVEDGATMWWDVTPEIKHNHDRRLLDFVSGYGRTRL